MKLPRQLTNRINWALDNCLPPIVRDSPLLMSPLFRLLFGTKGHLYAHFKDEVPSLSSRRYGWYYGELQDTFIDRPTDLSKGSIDRILDSIKGASVLDVACGRGYLCDLLARRPGLRVTGADLCPRSAAAAFGFVQADVERLPFPDGSFDTVISAHTLEHVLDFPAAVGELRRVARRRVVVVVPRQREYRYTFDLHVRFFPYGFSLKKAMGCPQAEVSVVDNDLFYVEEIDRG